MGVWSYGHPLERAGLELQWAASIPMLKLEQIHELFQLLYQNLVLNN